jgi:hypothetical protein
MRGATMTMGVMANVRCTREMPARWHTPRRRASGHPVVPIAIIRDQLFSRRSEDKEHGCKEGNSALQEGGTPHGIGKCKAVPAQATTAVVGDPLPTTAGGTGCLLDCSTEVASHPLRPGLWRPESKRARPCSSSTWAGTIRIVATRPGGGCRVPDDLAGDRSLRGHQGGVLRGRGDPLSSPV